MVESMLLTGFGGVIGVTPGVTISYLTSIAISRFTGMFWRFTIPLSAIGSGFGVATFVGLVFGLYPAMKAARKNPIESLRYE